MKDIDYNGLFVLLVGPSGAGKTYMENFLLEHNKHWTKLISFTTRDRRPGEVDGVDYHFINEEEMEDLNILQQMQIYGNYYGTCVEHLDESYRVHVLVVGADGPDQFKSIFGEDRVMTLFIKSPWYKRVYRLIKRDGFKKGLKRFVSDIGRFKDFDMSEVNIWEN